MSRFKLNSANFMRCFVALACATAVASATAQARADDNVLKLVPENALGFAIINKPESADAKIQEFGQQMKLPIPGLLAKLEGPGGIQAGLDKKRPIVVVALPPKGDAPSPAAIVLVPVTDYAKFVEQFKPNETDAGVSKITLFGSPSLTCKVGSYAAITAPPFGDALKDLKTADEIPAAIASWQTWLSKKDAAVVILAPGIKMASDKLQEGIATAKTALGQLGDQGKQALAGLDMYVSFAKSAGKEVASVGISLERNKQGVIRLCKRACLVPGGSWAQAVGNSNQGEDSAANDLLAGLPAGPFVFAGGGSLSADAMPSLMNMSFGMIKNMREMYGLSEEQADKLGELAKVKFPAIRGFSFEFGVPQGDEPILSRTVAVMRPADAKTFLADYEKYVVAYNKIVEKVDSPVFRPIQCEKVDVDGIASLKVTVEMPKMPNMPPEAAKVAESMYGAGGKIISRIVPVDEHTVVFGYASEEQMHKAITAIKESKPGLSSDEGIAKVARLLPRSTFCRFYISPAGGLNFVKQAAALAAPGAPLNIPELGATPPVAVGIIGGHDEVEAQIIVPPELLEEIARLVSGGAAAAK